MSLFNTCLIFLLLLNSFPSWAQERRLKACGNDEYPPWNWSVGGELIGACVDIAQRAFATKGYSLDVTYVGPWSRCQALLEAGRVDVSVCAIPTPSRFYSFNVIQPEMGSNEIYPYVHAKSDIDIRKASDLYGKRIGVIRGTLVGEPLDTQLRANSKLIETTSSEALWSLLLLRRVDVVIHGRESGSLQLKQLGIQDRVIQVPTMLTQASLNIMVSKKSRFVDEILSDSFEIGRFLTHPDYQIKLAMSLKLHADLYLQSSRKLLPSEDKKFTETTR